MSHINDRVAEFVFRELSPTEMADAERHLTECSACGQQVEAFRQTHAMLKAWPDSEPPRHIVFEAEKTGMMPALWRWLAPMAAAAAVAFAVAGVTIQSIDARPQVVTLALPAPSPNVQAVDYQKIVDQVRASQEAFLLDEFRKRDIEQKKQIQLLQAELAYLESMQRSVLKGTMENASSIQLLASREN